MTVFRLERRTSLEWVQLVHGRLNGNIVAGEKRVKHFNVVCPPLLISFLFKAWLVVFDRTTPDNQINDAIKRSSPVGAFQEV